MTDDPRLEAVVRAHARFYGNAETSTVSSVEGRAFYVMARAFLGEDADRKEVIDHTEQAEQSSDHDNATAPVVAGADPPWLDEAAKAAALASPADPDEWDQYSESIRDVWRRAARAVLRVANAQPVSDAEVEAANEAYNATFRKPHGAYVRNAFRAALEAAAKVRAGG